MGWAFVFAFKRGYTMYNPHLGGCTGGTFFKGPHMAFAILRTAKKKGAISMYTSLRHNLRLKSVSNADPDRGDNNTYRGVGSTAELKAFIDDRVGTVKRKVRPDAVKLVEIVVAASPEFTTAGGDIEGYLAKASDWLIDKFGRENVASITVHRDETTPHLHALVVPITRDGRLSAKDTLGGREKLSALQTEFHEQVGAGFGLLRGAQGSKASHQKLSAYYEQVNRQVSLPPLAPPRKPAPPTVIENIKQSDRYTKEAEAEIERLAKIVKSERSAAAALKTQVDALQVRDKEATAVKRKYNAERASNKKLLDAAVVARDISLVDVMNSFGCIQKDNDPKNWDTPVGRVSVQEYNTPTLADVFYNHDLSKGGGGAIDLVMHLGGYNFKEAMAHIATNLGGVAAAEAAVLHRVKKTISEAATKPAAPYVVPTGVDSTWPHVFDYLTRTRGISAEVVSKYHELGYLRSDAYQNAVFVNDKKNGHSLRGTLPGSAFKGSRGTKGFFSLGNGDPTIPVFVCEGALDALSLRSVGVNAIATNGSTDMTALHELLLQYRAQGCHLVAAFDNDDAGNKMAHAVLDWVDVGAGFARPKGKDWNDDLLELGDKFDPLRDVIWFEGSPGYIKPPAAQAAPVIEQRAAGATAPAKPRRMVR